MIVIETLTAKSAVSTLNFVVLGPVELDLSLSPLDVIMILVLLTTLGLILFDINFHSLSTSLLFVLVNLAIDMSLIPMA